MKCETNFDRIAQPYRLLEYLTLGRALERARERFLPLLSDRRWALILGDGDGRFTARLLAVNPVVQIEAVDESQAMLRLLRQRAEKQGDTCRLTTQQADARTYTSATSPDLVVTHFFLDCLTQGETAALATRLADLLQPGGLWLISEFRIPAGMVRLPALLLVRSLYFAFRVLTGLRTTSLPNYGKALGNAGLIRVEQSTSFGGILTSELWQRPAELQEGLQ